MRTISLRARRARAWAPLLILSLVFLSVCLHEEAEAARDKKQPCRARHPTRDFELTDGLCMPVHECLQSLSEIGRLKFPIFCGVRLLLPIVCCPLAERRASRTSTNAPEPARPPDESQPAHAPVMLAAQPEEAPAACETPSGQQGRCLPMEGCEALREQVMRKIFPPLCDIRGTTPYACCPTLNGLPQPDTPETTSPTTDAPNASTDYALRMLLLKLENNRHCGKSTGEPPRLGAFRASPTVVRGRSVNLGKYPFMVAIYRDDVSVRNYWCGGTLITYWVVLSAAHCFANSLSDTKYIARVGGVNISDTSGITFLQRNVTSVHVHPEYDDRRHYNDVALLRLEFPARHRSVKRSFACLPDAAAASSPPPATHGPEATVLGWGHNAFGGTLQTTLQEAQVPLVDNDACDRTYRSLGSYDRQFPSGINEHFVCAGNTTEGGADACQQDSGGPLIVNAGGRADEAYEVIGVVSFGVGCGTAAYPGVYSRVSHFLPWILNTTARIVPEDSFSTNFI